MEAPQIDVESVDRRPSEHSARLDRLRGVGAELARTLREVLDALPGAPLRPGDLATLLGVNRAAASKTLGATGKSDPLEVMHLVPGPEPLRRLVRAAGEHGVSAERIEAAEQAIAAFDGVIRREAGTRPALDAMISASLPGARDRFELASKYSIHKGVSQLKGVQGEHWLGVAVVAPSASDPLKHDLTWLNGAVAMQRLRPGVTVRFSYRYRGGKASGAEAASEERVDRSEASGATAADPGDSLGLDQFCVNPPARLVARELGDSIHYTLPDDLLGPREVVDMFVVDHHPAAMRRYAKDAPRHRNSLFVEPAIPVGTLVFDVILHDEAFPGSEPHLYLYDTGYDGIANVNDPDRDMDRVDVHETVEFLGHDMFRFHAAEVPGYAEILAHLGKRFGWDPARFRGYRTRIRYPVYGWQVCLSFEPPLAPSSS